MKKCVIVVSMIIIAILFYPDSPWKRTYLYEGNREAQLVLRYERRETKFAVEF